MRTLVDKVAAITGAGSGIGRATAVALAQRGCHLALSDVDEPGLAGTIAVCEAERVSVVGTRVDVADRDAVHRWADAVAARFGRVNVVVNNAGVALGSTIEAMRYEDLEWLMGINFWGVVHGTKAFLPHLKRSGDGHVVNLSSVFGLIAVPTQAAYNAAKFAVRGFTEALREELAVEGAPVGVTCVHPGGIRTNIARAARMTASGAYGMDRETAAAEFERTARTTPEEAAADIVRAILANRPRQLIGWDAVAIDLLQRLLPTGYQQLLVRVARRRRAQAA
jgi:NAD(P)-dependent dehydrogenase (short-subunit alcohol dehydrogenase family)